MANVVKKLDVVSKSQADWIALYKRLIRVDETADKSGSTTVVLECQQCRKPYAECKCWPGPKGATE